VTVTQQVTTEVTGVVALDGDQFGVIVVGLAFVTVAGAAGTVLLMGGRRG
jgi:hypothetical protein